MLESERYRLARLSRWAARAIGTIAAVFFVLMLIGSALSEGLGPVTTESVTLVLLVAVALAGCAVSWWRDMTAGVLLILTSIGFAVHIGCFAGHGHALAWSIIGLPYLVAGVLILSAWWLSRQNR
jgi:hypothetical protein